MSNEKTTGTLTDILKNTSGDKIDEYLEENAESLINGAKPFAEYMRRTIKGKGLLKQTVFLNADISEGYGYKLLSEEKRTRKRDVILRLCIGAGFGLKETQKALELYKMPSLYPKDRRDAVIMIAVNTGIHEISKVNDLLDQYGMEKLEQASMID
ncbi:MAG: hypothetical protein IKI74_04185 [Christensenellaceae bacterium]|nr:hypothetical protein [Christensenellaceae bacterium]